MEPIVKISKRRTSITQSSSSIPSNSFRFWTVAVWARPVGKMLTLESSWFYTVILWKNYFCRKRSNHTRFALFLWPWVLQAYVVDVVVHLLIKVSMARTHETPCNQLSCDIEIWLVSLAVKRKSSTPLYSTVAGRRDTVVGVIRHTIGPSCPKMVFNERIDDPPRSTYPGGPAHSTSSAVVCRSFESLCQLSWSDRVSCEVFNPSFMEFWLISRCRCWDVDLELL